LSYICLKIEHRGGEWGDSAMNIGPGRLTVGRLMLAIAALAVLLAAGMYRWQNSDVDQSMTSTNLRAIARGDAPARRQAAIKLAGMKPSNPDPVLAALAGAAVGDAAPEVRQAAVSSLGVVLAASVRARVGNSPETTQESEADVLPTRAIIRAMSDPRPEVRCDAVGALGAIPATPKLTSAVVPTLLRLFDDADVATRAGAVMHFCWLKEPPIEARGRVVAMMERDPEVKVRVAAIQALVYGWPSAELYPILLSRRNQAPTLAERSMIIRCLADQIPPPPEIIPTLVDLMETDEVAGRFVPWMLAKYGKAARPWLGAIRRVAERQFEEPQLNIQAAHALVKIDPDSPEARAMLGPLGRRLRDSTDADERGRLAWLLEAYGASAAPAVPILRETLKSPIADARRIAARLLGRLGPSAQVAVDDLEALSRQDPDASVRTSALSTLQNLRSQMRPPRFGPIGMVGRGVIDRGDGRVYRLSGSRDLDGGVGPEAGGIR